MKVIEYNDKKYYVNGLSGDLKKQYDSANKGFREQVLFANSPVFFYNHKNFQNDPIYLSDAVSILRDLKQPSELTVRRAMIWGVGYGGDLDYKIKSGGESNSDSLYSSSLTIDIAHPKTFLDTKVVIMKKYSKNFEDVLITEKEIQDLYKICETPKEKELNKIFQMESGISFLIKIKKGVKINVNGKYIYANKNMENKFKRLVFENSTPEKFSQCIDSLIEHQSRYLTVSLMEGSSQTTEEWHKEIRQYIIILENLKTELINEYSPL